MPGDLHRQGTEDTSTPPQPGLAKGFLELLDSSEIFGWFAWTEGALFEVLGSWSTNETDPAVGVAFDDHSRRHFWHSQLWVDRLPQLSNVDSEGLVRPRDVAYEKIMEDLTGLDSTVGRLVGGYRVMCPQLLADYQRVGAMIDPVSAPSVLRWMDFMVQDLREQWLWGECRLRDLVRSDAELSHALDTQRRLEERLIEGRPLF